MKHEKTCLKTQFEYGVESYLYKCSAGGMGLIHGFPPNSQIPATHRGLLRAVPGRRFLHLNERSRAAAARYVRVHPACAPPPRAGGATPPHTTSSARPESRSPRERQST